LVSKKLVGPPILGVDFIVKTKLVLDIEEGCCHFGFAPAVNISLVLRNRQRREPGSRPPPLRCHQVRCGDLSARQRKLLEEILQNYQDVLTDHLGSTNLLEYDIQVLDHTPVSLAP
jgi:hypothetical protein